MFLLHPYSLERYLRAKNLRAKNFKYRIFNEKKMNIAIYNVQDFISLYGDSYMVDIICIENGEVVSCSFKELLGLVLEYQVIGLSLCDNDLSIDLNYYSILHKWIHYIDNLIYIDETHSYIITDNQLIIGNFNKEKVSPFIRISSKKNKNISLCCFRPLYGSYIDCSLEQIVLDFVPKLEEIENGTLGKKYDLVVKPNRK